MTIESYIIKFNHDLISKFLICNILNYNNNNNLKIAIHLSYSWLKPELFFEAVVVVVLVEFYLHFAYTLIKQCIFSSVAICTLTIFILGHMSGPLPV